MEWSPLPFVNFYCLVLDFVPCDDDDDDGDVNDDANNDDDCNNDEHKDGNDG